MKHRSFTEGSTGPHRLHVVLPLALMAALYWLSSIPGVPDAADPGAGAVFRWLPPAVQNVMHIPAFATLSAAWRWALAAWMRTAGVRAYCSFTVAAVYGLVDEWHQSFVPGRYASATDVALDVLGALIGIWLMARYAGRKSKRGA